MKKFLTMLTISVCAAHAFGGHEVANGGDVVVCYTGPDRSTITSFQLFDHWELLNLIPGAHAINLGNAQLSVQDKIALELDRIARFDSEMAKNLKNYTDSISGQINNYLITGAELPEIDDTNPRLIPNSNCFIEQFAVQWKDLVTDQKRFLIAEKYYNHPLMTNDNRAGIILHEALYRYAILNFKPSDSQGVRNFNYAFATLESGTMTIQDYVKLLEASGLNDAQCRLTNSPELARVIYAKTNVHMDKELCADELYATPKFRFLMVKKNALFKVTDQKFPATDGSVKFGLSFQDFEYLTANGWIPFTFKKYDGRYVRFIRRNGGDYLELRFNQFWDLTPGTGSFVLPTQFQVGGTPVQCRDTVGSDRQGTLTFTYTHAGALVGCSHLLSPTTFLLATGQNVIIRDDVFSPDLMNITQGELYQPTPLYLNGTNLIKSFVLNVYFNLQGQVTEGRLSHTPEIIMIDGHPIDINFSALKIDNGGGVRAYISYPWTNIRVDGLRVLRPATAATPSLSQLCLRYTPSFSQTYAMSPRYHSEFILDSELFYNPSTLNSEYKSDEQAHVLDEVYCSGFYNFQF